MLVTSKLTYSSRTNLVCNNKVNNVLFRSMKNSLEAVAKEGKKVADSALAASQVPSIPPKPSSPVPNLPPLSNHNSNSGNISAPNQTQENTSTPVSLPKISSPKYQESIASKFGTSPEDHANKSVDESTNLPPSLNSPIQVTSTIGQDMKQNALTRINTNVESSSIQNITEEPKATQIVHIVDEDGSISDILVPLPPPLPPLLSTSLTSKNTKDLISVIESDGSINERPLTFSEEIQRKVEERAKKISDISKTFDILENSIVQKSLENINNHSRTEKNLDALEERGLLDRDESKAKHTFYEYLIQNHVNDYVILDSISDERANNVTFNIGLLKITAAEETILLSGQQLHPIVLYIHDNDNVIVWGYLTSQGSKGAKFLSSHQPFSVDKKTQYVKLVQPYVVLSKDIENLPQDKNIIENYIKEVSSKLTDYFLKETLTKLKEPLKVYDGCGITNDEIENAIKVFDDKVELKVLKYLKEYQQKVNQGITNDKLNAWLSHIEETDKLAYKKLKELLKNNETKD